MNGPRFGSLSAASDDGGYTNRRLYDTDKPPRTAQETTRLSPKSINPGGATIKLDIKSSSCAPSRRRVATVRVVGKDVTSRKKKAATAMNRGQGASLSLHRRRNTRRFQRPAKVVDNEESYYESDYESYYESDDEDDTNLFAALWDEFLRDLRKW